MNMSRLPHLLVAVVALTMATISCSSDSQTPPEATPTEVSQEATAPSVETAPDISPTPQSPTQTSQPEPTAVPEPTLPPLSENTCEEGVCVLPGTFVLERPVGGEGRVVSDHSARFGVYQAAKDDSSRGAYFLNSTGTPVIAAADGEVVVAGDDSQTPYDRFRNIYGNLVVLRHDLPGISEPIFTLYGHLSQVSVSVGEEVERGQEIGQVGSTGIVTGSTLLFQVRMGENSYQAVRNPALWMVPLADESGQPRGALAGRVVDEDGNYLKVENIVIEQLAGQGQPAIDQFYIQTYSGKSLIGTPPYEENFALGDLPAGDYQISFFMSGMQQMEVEVQPGMITVATFVMP